MIRYGVPGIPGGFVGWRSVLNHIQCGGGCSGLKLSSGDGRESGRSGWSRMGGTTPKCHILHRWWYGSVIRPGMAAGGFQHSGRDVLLSGPAE